MSEAQRGGIARALTIAGSDSGGGAGIQADLKTFAALGVYGTSALTAVTAQNTVGVRAAQELSPEIVAAQIDAVLDDIGADAAKTGMLANASIISAVADRLRRHAVATLVVDPVMVAKSGDRLLRKEAVRALCEVLLPLALVVTPNLPEAEVLAERPIRGRRDLEEAARRIAATGARYVLLKGGHAPGDPVDVLFDGHSFHEYAGERIATKHTHGTGCTLSAALAAYLALGLVVEEAVDRAKRFLTAALRAAYPVGHGHGPVHHFFALDALAATRAGTATQLPS